MNFLTQEQRAKAVESLSRAPDEILISAMVDFRRLRHFEEGTRANFNEVVDELTERRIHDEPVSEDKRGTAIKVEEVAAVRPNIDPGPSTLARIGSDTKERILAGLPWSIGTKYEQHLRLLWARGEVRFDGERFYL